MSKSTHFVGRTDDGSRVWVEINLGTDRVSFVGSMTRRNGRSVSACGQITDDVAAVTRPARGWTTDDISSLVRVWKRWHLNDMRAECAHQRDLGWTYATHAGCACPTCAYVIGSAWLTEDLPAHVRTEVERLTSLPRGASAPNR